MTPQVINKNAFIAKIVNGQLVQKTLLTPDVDNNIGRSSKSCVFALGQDTKVSRVHCVLKFDSQSGMFLISDTSTNGTFLEDGTRLEKGVPFTIYPDTVFYLSEPDNKLIALSE